MNEYLSLNKISYLAQTEKKHPFLIWTTLFLVIFFWLSCFVKIRLSYKTVAIYNSTNNTLEIYWQYEKIEKFNEYEKIKIENSESNLSIQNMSEIGVDNINRQNYQTIEIVSPKIYRHNQVISIQLLDHQEKVIIKLKKIIIGG